MITYQEDKKLLKIVIYPNLKSEIKLGYWIIIFALSLLSILIGFYLFKDFRWLFYLEIEGWSGFGMLLILCFLNYFFIKTLFSKEVLIITKRDVFYENGFLLKDRLIIPRKKIIKLKYAGEERFTKHPLEPIGFDYLGIGTGEKEVQFLIKEGNLEFILNNGKYRFGRNVYFEDANELMKRILNFS